MALLILVNLAFALGLVTMLIVGITDNRIWLGFIAAWCFAEALLTRDQSIKWWQWLLLLAGLGVLDLAILYFFKP
jgi:hypothetical protein